MNGIAVMSSQSPQIGAGREILDQRLRAQHHRPVEASNAHRMPTPLQVSTIPAVAAMNHHNDPPSSSSPRSPKAFRSISDSSSSPRSPRSLTGAASDQPKSPRERLEEFLASEDVVGHDRPALDGALAARANAASPPKMQSFSQLRNVSSPLPDSHSTVSSSPPSPLTTAATPPLGGSSVRPDLRSMPRTSSIDSAISSVSTNLSHAAKPSQDSSSSSFPAASSLISAAGSAEAAIQHLLKEKQHVAAQNAQLWKLVDKQRTLLLGLNKDLERVMEEKERYRRKLKEMSERPIPAPLADGQNTAARVMDRSGSPAPSDISTDLPIQRQSVESIVPEATVKPLTIRGQNGTRPVGDAMTQDPRTQSGSKKHAASNHAHKQTSSSDVNVFPSVPSTTEMPPAQITNPKGSTIDNRGGRGLPNGPIPRPTMSSASSFTAKRSQTNTSKPFVGPELVLADNKPAAGDAELMTPPRKPPPAPLDLGSAKGEALSPSQKFGPEDHSESEYEDSAEPSMSPVERGRKKTREDDDREREAALVREKAERSKSKPEKGSHSRSGSSKSTKKDSKPQPVQAVPMPPTIKALSPEPALAGTSSFLAGPTSLAGVLHPQQESHKESTIVQRTLVAAPMSPGLPVSPRPADRPINPPTPRFPRDATGATIVSPPLSPRSGLMGLPLSPRAPRQPIPFPPHTPMSMAPMSPKPPVIDTRTDSTDSGQGSASSGRKDSSIDEQADAEALTASPHTSPSSHPQGIFKGFISDSYPGLLIPPNALPSIKIRVVSSRLKPSRQSLVLKGADDEPVFTLGVSARYDRQDLWQVEKPMLSLQNLDHQLRQSPGFNVRVPERSLFSGHAPAKIDARRVALENYFEAVLDTQLDERGAIVLCTYLSSNVSEPAASDAQGPTVTPNASVMTGSGSIKGQKITKEGYLTKKGKNFGGWKARYFVLDKPVLEYYETPGSRGGPLGQIRLHNAQIGRQSPKASVSPTRNDDSDGQYRHAFLIREPKRKDASSFVDHVLCAENDAERDAWVEALLCYVEGPAPEHESKTRPPLSHAGSGSGRAVTAMRKASVKTDVSVEESPESESFDALQAVPYEETRPAQAPHVSVTPESRPTDTPSPAASPITHPVRAPPTQSKAISGPQNGAKISDVGAWGNKPMTTPLNNPKEPKKSRLWGFRDKNEHVGITHPNGSNLSLTQEQQEYQEHATNVKAAFGAPLAEAVEYCAPRGVNVCLPAVAFRCLEYLEAKNAASEEGLFRMSGSNNLIRHLRHKFNTEGDFDFLGEGQPYFDVHAVASLLKLYLRELPSMILTKELHMQFLSVLDLKDDAKKVAAYGVLVHKLPMPNYCLIRALSEYLITVVNNSDINKMGIRNVCIVFSPTLNIPAPVFAMFLSAFDSIFERNIDPEKEDGIPTLEFIPSTPDTLTPDDIRSPRKQMFSDIPTPSYNQSTFGMNSLNSVLPRYEQNAHDTGFIPLQPAYEGPPSIPYSLTPSTGSGREYSSNARIRETAQGGGNGLAGTGTGAGADVKARRRESSMLTLGGQPAKKSSSSALRGNNELENSYN